MYDLAYGHNLTALLAPFAEEDAAQSAAAAQPTEAAGAMLLRNIPTVIPIIMGIMQDSDLEAPDLFTGLYFYCKAKAIERLRHPDAELLAHAQGANGVIAERPQRELLEEMQLYCPIAGYVSYAKTRREARAPAHTHNLNTHTHTRTHAHTHTQPRARA